MVEPSDSKIDAAIEQGRELRLNEPRATAARYDRQRDRVVVDLTNQCSLAFPPKLVQGLEHASDDELAKVELLGAGYGLHWEKLDVDISVSGLMAGLFGTKSYMARRAGRSKSAAKTEAARKNGAKGGRPKKIANGHS
jgi:hypothetical protein